jgi:outer membrane lipoprotein-sorting protein
MNKTVVSGQWSVVSKYKSGLTSKWAIAVCLCAVLVMQAKAFAADPAARTIMEDVYRQDNAHDISMRASFQIFDKQGQSTKKEFNLKRLGLPGDSKTLVVFTAPKEIRGLALLSIDEKGANERQYMYVPAQQRVRSVATQERTARFLGTDFTFEDIGERVLDDFNYRLLGNGETMDGHKTTKVEATPVDPTRSQYKSIYFWVAQDAPVILFAEFYDPQGQKVRVMHATDIKRENGIWGARNTEMATVADGTRTVLRIDEVKFNTKPDEKLFTPDGLAGALGPDKSK